MRPVTTRSETGRALRINVKYYGPFTIGGTKEQRDRAYADTLQDWWAQANIIARSHGYHEVRAAGRSGGWLLPAYKGAYATDAESPHFKAFHAAISEHYGSAPDLFRFHLDAIIAADAEAARVAKAEAACIEHAPMLAAALRDLCELVESAGLDAGPARDVLAGYNAALARTKE